MSIYNYAQLEENNIKKNNEIMNKYSFWHKTREDAMNSVRKSIKTSYSSGNNTVIIYGCDDQIIDKVCKEFKEEGLIHIGHNENIVYLDNRWFWKKWF